MEAKLVITVQEKRIPKFVALLRAGFRVKAQVGCSIKELLCGQLGLARDYYNTRLQTLFLNSKPVDDPDAAQVMDGSTLALSAAMPGLAGATLRKGGHYSRMRGSITHSENSQAGTGTTRWVTLKLFNLILKEMGPHFLNQGVWLNSTVIRAFFQDQAGCLDADIQGVEWNGQPIGPQDILSIAWPKGWVFLKIT